LEADAEFVANNITEHTWLEEYEKNGVRPVRHSDSYRNNEQPAYRIISSRYIRLFRLFERIAGLSDNNGVRVIAVDGRSASGKTTAAAQLKDIIKAAVIHTDDFFLPPELRTETRLSQPGGNMHHERFSSEVLPYIRSEKAFAYQAFDCSVMSMGEMREVEKSQWRIVEGAYSCHPALDNYMDIRVFSDIGEDAQFRRICARNGEETALIYKSRWIPMEESYFKEYKIKENADIII